MKIMLIAVFVFGILAQAEALLISSNNTDARDLPSTVSPLRVETEETASYTSYPPREDDNDPVLDVTSTLHPDIPNSSYDVNSVLLTKTNATIFAKTNNSLFYKTETSFSEANFIVSPGTSATEFPEINAPLSPDDSTTVFSKVTISLTPEVNTENPVSNCPKFEEPQLYRHVLKCYCKGNEIYVNGKCQVYDGVIVIPVERGLKYIYKEEANVMRYEVMVQDINCDTSKYSYTNFTKNQFRFRPRGDVVLLKEAGKLEGQSINKYCIFHHLDEYDDLTWTMKACVPIPSVPRCCPPGKAIQEGKCEVANTPDVLKPPISANIFSDGIDWGNITDYLHPVKCDSKYNHMVTFRLGQLQTNLVSLADGVANIWVSGDTDKKLSYLYCSGYCVDGINNSSGSVDYFVSYCSDVPMQTHEDTCTKEPCLRKCCEYGYSMDENRFGCVPDPNSTFTPSTEADISTYTIVFGWPLCTPISTLEEKISVDRMGSLIIIDKELTSTGFCVDRFIDNEQRQEIALACLTETSLGLDVRPYLSHICKVISLIFLMITIVSHMLVPRLLENGGFNQFCLLIAVFIAHITNFSIIVFHNRFTYHVCVNLAIAMQFGFLATYFWLNVMCFEIWRKIRRLKNYCLCKSYPNKYYMMYGWGIPFCICVLTILMQKYAPRNVPSVIKPYIGVSRCWFGDEIANLTYFYCPIAVLFLFDSVLLVFTYINYKIMPQNYKETTNDTKVLGAGVISEHRNTPSRQITNYVHEFKQNLKFFLFLSVWNFIIWVTKRYLRFVNPSEQWDLIMNSLDSLQGFFLFMILLTNSNKRKHLEEKYPKLFGWIKKSNRLSTNMKRWLQNIVSRIFSRMRSLFSSIGSQFSNSTAIRTLTTSIRSPNPSSSSSEVQI